MESHELERLLKVCRLRLTEEEKRRMSRDIDEIIGYFDTIESVKCDEAPAYQPIDLPEQLREDEPKEFAETGLILKGTKTYRFYIVGPKV